MRSHIPTLLILLVLVFQQLPLSSVEAINTDSFDCTTASKKWKSETWVSDRLSFVRRGQLWLGMGGGTVADFGFAMERDRDHTFLFRGNWDHYADPNGIGDQIVDMNFAPDYILLLPGEKVTLYYHCQSFGKTAGTGHIMVNFWRFP